MYVPANKGPLETRPDGRLYDAGNKDVHLAIDDQVHDSVSKMFLDNPADPATKGTSAPYGSTKSPFGLDISADPANEPIPDNLKPSSDNTDAYFKPGKDNPMYLQAFQHWMEKNPDKAKAFEKNIDEGNAGAKNRNRQVVNDLQMAINRGEISTTR